MFRNSGNFPHPSTFAIGSPESRAAARALADAKREPPKVILIGRRADDGALLSVFEPGGIVKMLDHK